MPRSFLRVLVCLFTALFLRESPAAGQQAATPASTEGDFVVKNFQFRSGESLPELRLHYTTLGKPARDAQGRTTNAVLILHGTGGTGQQFLQPIFSGELFGPGQLLDAARYYIILPDGIGHGKSSKPSDGLHAHFPQYDYDDMVAAHHRLTTEGLGVNHLRLVMGTSMGCMHSFVWGETYPDFMDAVMPLACLPVEIAGRKDRKSTRLNSSHGYISYAVFCLKKNNSIDPGLPNPFRIPNSRHRLRAASLTATELPSCLPALRNKPGQLRVRSRTCH